MNKSGR